MIQLEKWKILNKQKIKTDCLQSKQLLKEIQIKNKNSNEYTYTIWKQSIQSIKHQQY